MRKDPRNALLLSRTKMDARSGSLLLGRGALEHPHDVALLHDQVLDAIDLDLGAGPLAEQHAVAGAHVDRDELAALVTTAGADGHDLALRRLLLGGIRNDDAAGGALLGIDALDDDTIVKRTKFHELLLEILAVMTCREWGGRRGSPP